MFYSPSDMAEFERRVLHSLASISAACWLIAFLIGSGLLMIFLLAILGY